MACCEPYKKKGASNFKAPDYYGYMKKIGESGNNNPQIINPPDYGWI
jgi:hypothetical protein